MSFSFTFDRLAIFEALGAYPFVFEIKSQIWHDWRHLVFFFRILLLDGLNNHVTWSTGREKSPRVQLNHTTIFN